MYKASSSFDFLIITPYFIKLKRDLPDTRRTPFPIKIILINREEEYLLTF